MGMVFATNVLIAIVHILACVDVEILLLGVLDLEKIFLDGGRVLSKVSADKWLIHWCSQVHEGALEEVTEADDGGELPTEGHSLHVGVLGDDFESSPKTDKPGNVIVSPHGLV